MDANEITFGIEIECLIPGRPFYVGSYHAGIQIPGFPEGWNAQHDGSLHSLNGVEVVSPVLKGADGLRQVVEVLGKLRALGARVNQRCGFHVHVGWTAPLQSQLSRLVSIVANFEKAIYASTGTRSRENGSYCRSIREHFRNENHRRAGGDRFHVLNLANLYSARQPTVEFRAFAGTLNLAKLTGYIRMCVGLVERALETSRKTNWDPKNPVETSPIHREGEGQTHLTRLFYQLGWTKGRAKKVYGDLQAEGAPGIRPVKKVLMKMARKYDGGLA